MDLMQKMLSPIQIFDSNMHVTVNGVFKDYQYNMPANFNTYFSKFDENIILRGLLHVGISGIGGYEDKKFIEISSPKNAYKFLAIEDKSLTNEKKNYLQNKNVLGIKLHPKSLGLKLEDTIQISYEAILACSEFHKFFGICSYFGDKSISKDEINSFKKIIDFAISHKVKIILFHACGLNFLDFYNSYRDNPYVFFDTSFSLIRFYDSSIQDLYLKELDDGATNIGFGTDFPDHSIKDYFPYIEEFKQILTNKAFKRFTYKNIEDFICLIPKN